MKNIYFPNPITLSQSIIIISTTGRLNASILFDIQSYYQKLGYQVRIGKSCFISRKLNEADDQSRAKEIMDAIVDPKIGAIIFACGGEHSERLLPYLDPLKIRKHSKIIIGYSDISSILSYFVETCHRVVYHGRMALDATSNTKKQTKMLREVLEGRLSKINLPSLKVLRPGKAEGVLKGGCISVLTKLLRGEYEPFYHHCILFIEDIHESIHSLSHFFNSFDKAKKFNHLKGVLFGEMLDCGDNLELIFLISQYFSRLNLPIGINLPSGHGKNDVFLPLGAHVLISLGSKRSYLKVLPKKTGEYL